MQAAATYRDILGPGNFFLEMQYQGIEEQRIVNIGLAPIARDLDLPLVCTNDVHYLKNSDFRPHDILLCIGTGKTRQRRRPPALSRRPVLPEDGGGDGGGLRRLSRGDGQHRADRRALPRRSVGTVNHLPNFDVPAGLHARRLLRARGSRGVPAAAAAAAGARRRAACSRHTVDEYERRLTLRNRDDQADEIPGYFLIVWDFIRYAREQGNSGRAGPRIGRRQLRRLLPAHHRRRSDRVRPHLRALPQSRARVAARHRHRLLRAAARRGHRLRHAQVRPRERRADHHVRDDEGAGRRARRGAGHGHPVRRRRPGRQGGAAGARHDARRRRSSRIPRSRRWSRRTSASRSCSPSRGGSRA